MDGKKSKVTRQFFLPFKWKICLTQCLICFMKKRFSRIFNKNFFSFLINVFHYLGILARMYTRWYNWYVTTFFFYIIRRSWNIFDLVISPYKCTKQRWWKIHCNLPISCHWPCSILQKTSKNIIFSDVFKGIERNQWCQMGLNEVFL